MSDRPTLDYARGLATDGGKRRLRGKRVLAAVLDGVIVSPVFLVPAVLSFGPGDYGVLNEALFFAVCLYMFSEAVRGKTLGKYFAGIAVVSEAEVRARELGVAGKLEYRGTRWRVLARCGVKNLFLLTMLFLTLTSELIPQGVNINHPLIIAFQTISVVIAVCGMSLGVHWLYQVVRDPSSSIPDELAGTRVVEVGGGGDGGDGEVQDYESGQCDGSHDGCGGDASRDWQRRSDAAVTQHYRCPVFCQVERTLRQRSQQQSADTGSSLFEQNARSYLDCTGTQALKLIAVVVLSIGLRHAIQSITLCGSIRHFYRRRYSI